MVTLLVGHFSVVILSSKGTFFKSRGNLGVGDEIKVPWYDLTDDAVDLIEDLLLSDPTRPPPPSQTRKSSHIYWLCGAGPG